MEMSCCQPASAVVKSGMVMWAESWNRRDSLLQYRQREVAVGNTIPRASFAGRFSIFLWQFVSVITNFYPRLVLSVKPFLYSVKRNHHHPHHSLNSDFPSASLLSNRANNNGHVFVVFGASLNILGITLLNWTGQNKRDHLACQSEGKLFLKFISVHVFI